MFYWLIELSNTVPGIGVFRTFLNVFRYITFPAGRIRLASEAVIALVACYALVRLGRVPFSTSLVLPFFKDVALNFGWFFVIFGAFIMVGAGNAVNLTDGLDGLAIVPVMIAAASFGMIAYLTGNAVFSDYLQINYVAGTGELAVVCSAGVAGLSTLKLR